MTPHPSADAWRRAARCCASEWFRTAMALSVVGLVLLGDAPSIPSLQVIALSSGLYVPGVLALDRPCLASRGVCVALIGAFAFPLLTDSPSELTTQIDAACDASIMPALAASIGAWLGSQPASRLSSLLKVLTISVCHILLLLLLSIYWAHVGDLNPLKVVLLSFSLPLFAAFCLALEMMRCARVRAQVDQLHEEEGAALIEPAQLCNVEDIEAADLPADGGHQDDTMSLASSDDDLPSRSSSDSQLRRAREHDALITQNLAAIVDGVTWLADDHRDENLSHNGPRGAQPIQSAGPLMMNPRLASSRQSAIDVMRAGRMRRWRLRIKFRAVARTVGRLISLNLEAAARVYSPGGRGAIDAAMHYEGVQATTGL
jgi:hypothetical protein